MSVDLPDGLPVVAVPFLAPNQVHTWWVRFSAWSKYRAEFQRILSHDERARAARFVFEVDRERFELARGLLRILLSAYAHVPPERLDIVAGANGKPRLNRMSPPELSFSLSRSNGLGLYGVSGGLPLGVDIEHMRQDFAFEEFADRFFLASERSRLRRAPPARRRRMFFACWTRKEAVVKAHGATLWDAVNDMHAAVVSGARSSYSVARDGLSAARARWCVRGLRVPPSFEAAIAVQTRDVKIVQHRLRVIRPPVDDGPASEVPTRRASSLSHCDHPNGLFRSCSNRD